MALSEEQIKQNDHIPTSEIQQDILDTQTEIDQLGKELEVLVCNPTQNKLAIYMTEGKLSKRREFVNSLQSILDYRKNQTA